MLHAKELVLASMDGIEKLYQHILVDVINDGNLFYSQEVAITFRNVPSVCLVRKAREWTKNRCKIAIYMEP